ncbi:uncharacterized protein CC84DRAFT_811078 [Paraphaeosphaeria sporulosa]|uniref:Secreted protein n=1 Tax=Paraphaeosphaeria sporulosa TaxID=1460663 RepID=A0A177CBC3_9PLEO|nr:uncharacterized protein CC84DRAFT_811078 [Paraphaeosphaeria sporulosa]OAG04983.1 hypothetical protein CC84DRAFT_811078 [Paraphaeosphaeria sporulosa]
MRMSEQLHILLVACCVLSDYLFPMSFSQRHCIVLVFQWHFTAYLLDRHFVYGRTWKGVGGITLSISPIFHVEYQRRHAVQFPTPAVMRATMIQ